MTNCFQRLHICKSLLIGFAVLTASTAAFAEPVLRESIIVTTPIVTVGDMFENAGALSEEGLFRAPAPGTAGQVNIEVIRIATAKAGFTQFENPGIINVSVARAGVQVDQNALNSLIAADLGARGLLSGSVKVTTLLDDPLDDLYAAESAAPVALQILRYVPGSNRFTARFALAGQNSPIDISGQLQFTIPTPHLVRALPAGSILQNTDFQMRDIPLQFAQNQGVPSLDQLIGQQLQRQLLEGVAVRLNDVAAPILIARNQIVTLYLQSGALTLTVKGQALADASRGQSVSVLNLLSNTVVQGIAINQGTVEIQSTSNRLASL